MTMQALSTLLSLLLLVHQSWAQIGPDPNWLQPDGSKSDFTSTFAAGAGKSIVISWKALNKSSADLWVSHWNQSAYPWYKSVATNIDISVDGTYRWDLDVPASTIQNDNHFVLRFYPRNAAYGILQFAQKASPGFLLTGGSATTTSQASSKSAQPTSTISQTSTLSIQSSALPSTEATSTDSASSSQSSTLNSSFTTIVTTTNSAGSTITATITTAGSSPTVLSGSSQTSSSSSNLSIAGQVGIGVGAGILIIVLFVAGCLFGRRFRTGGWLHRDGSGSAREVYPMLNSKQAGGDNMAARDSKTMAQPQTFNCAEDAKLVLTPSDSESPRTWYQSRTPWVEIQGSRNFAVEKSGAMVRPGIHEIG